MSFELNPRETFAENVGRLARQGLDRVLASLPGEGATENGAPPGDEAVHAARKELKRLRALLRLARAGLGEEIFARENTDLRNAGRALSAVRDARVLVAAFDGLRGESFGRVAPETSEAIRGVLLEDVRATGAALEAGREIPAAAETLRAVRERAGGWPLPSRDGWRVPGRGLEAVYRKGWRAMRRAANAPAEADFHEWRKQVKYLAAHVRLLHPLRPKKLRALARTLDRLAELLGDEHDLSVLAAHLRGRPEAWLSAHDLEVVGGVIEAHRRALQAEALEIGRAAYGQAPGCVGRRFKRDWKAWRAGE